MEFKRSLKATLSNSFNKYPSPILNIFSGPGIFPGICNITGGGTSFNIRGKGLYRDRAYSGDTRSLDSSLQCSTAPRYAKKPTVTEQAWW